MEIFMDKQQRIDNFQNWINEGNELTIEDMLAVAVSCMANDKARELNTFLMLEGQIYDISIKARRFTDA